MVLLSAFLSFSASPSDIAGDSTMGWGGGARHGNSYGNADAMEDIRQRIEWITSIISVSRIILFGNSMGGPAAIDAVTRRVARGVVGVYLTDPVYDIEQRFNSNNSSARTNVMNAYGIASDESNLRDKLDGFDPARTPWHKWRGLPFRIRSAPTDSTVLDALHSEALAAALEPHHWVELVNLESGGHNASNRFNAADMTQLIQLCCGGPVKHGA